MLLPNWGLFTACAFVGAVGLVAAYRKPWLVIPAFLAILSILAVTIVRLRDPLGLPVAQRREAGTLSYLAVLFWSSVAGAILPVLGVYLGLRSRSRTARRGGDAAEET